MKVILVDTRHFGTQLRNARRSAHIGSYDFAELLHIPHKELVRYESGRAVIPDEILNRILLHGILRMKSQ